MLIIVYASILILGLALLAYGTLAIKNKQTKRPWANQIVTSWVKNPDQYPIYAKGFPAVVLGILYLTFGTILTVFALVLFKAGA